MLYIKNYHLLKMGSKKIDIELDLLPIKNGLASSLLKKLNLEDRLLFYQENKNEFIVTSEPFRKYLNGKGIIVKERLKFENYRKKVSEFYDFIEKDGADRFPDSYRKHPLPKVENHTDYQIVNPWDEELGKREWDRQKEIEGQTSEWMMKSQEQRQKKSLQDEQFKQNRILQSKEDKRIHALNTIIERLGPYYPGQKNILVDYHYFNYENRMDDLNLLKKFLEEAKGFGCFREFNVSSGPRTRFGFLDANLEKIKEYRDNLRDQLSPEMVQPDKKIKLGEYKIKFDDAKPVIVIDGKECPLPPFKNEHYFCRAMFKYEIGEFIDWSQIYEDMSGILEKLDKKDTGKHKRSVQDAMYAVNKRIKEIVGTDDELFTWKNKSIKRNY